MSCRARSGFAKRLEYTFQFIQQVGLRPEMAEVIVTLVAFFLHYAFHFRAIVAMKSVSLNIGSLYTFACKNIFEGALDRSCSCAGRSGNRNNGMLD